ncbi:hypothetical protein [Hymenobacter psychrophilus]|uniref:Uncharacterized protein n=1 Tax=Hymenobacter psychrophilus TaxID=651662 RepID=A0A1H3H1R2_9BACT|nr:hypothetical protein [Hymenobacter psychrophilus]SDY09472.1 hypothetical protein SAMN04488069_105263 [Hymenobacter psychrophilus]
MNQDALVGFGFWRSVFEPLLPDPAQFVDDKWDSAERLQVINYLRQGRQLTHWMGYSWCRFGCKAADMGAADLTDGSYCWPEGLAHYLENHQVRLPHEIVSHILAQHLFASVPTQQAETLWPVDMSWWLGQKGWNTSTTDFSQGSEALDRDLLRRFDRNLIDFGPETEKTRVARQQMLDEVRRKWQ